MKIDLPDSLIEKIREWGVDREETLERSGLYCDDHLNELCDSVDEQADIIVDELTQLIQLAIEGDKSL